MIVNFSLLGDSLYFWNANYQQSPFYCLFETEIKFQICTYTRRIVWRTTSNARIVAQNLTRNEREIVLSGTRFFLIRSKISDVTK